MSLNAIKKAAIRRCKTVSPPQKLPVEAPAEPVRANVSTACL
ncbi:hypothetical protein [Alteraurantiacibacter buctensis]|nr:hypothetical protein [Alteraurantiacibacter buctensis]